MIVEVYLDQTDVRNSIRHEYALLGIGNVLLVVMGFQPRAAHAAAIHRHVE